jgi:hypothetical protein
VTVFATPDFGSSGFLASCLLVSGAIVALLVLIGVLRGTRLLQSESAGRRRRGIILLVLCGIVPLFCCLGPSVAVRVTHGNFPLWRYPNGKIKEGMARDEVEAVLGRPHERFQSEDGEGWYYWLDSFGMGYFGVRFGPDGRVIGTHGN